MPVEALVIHRHSCCSSKEMDEREVLQGMDEIMGQDQSVIRTPGNDTVKRRNVEGGSGASKPGVQDSDSLSVSPASAMCLLNIRFDIP